MEHIGDILQNSKWQQLSDQRKSDREKAETMLREDHEVLAIFKDIILEYDNELKRIKRKRKEFLESDKYAKELGDFAPYFRQRIFDDVLDGKRIPQLERGLKNMVFTLNRTKQNLKVNEDWERKYEHATRDIQIGNVIRHFCDFHGSFSQLVKCSFHDDKTASLKVYEKNNRFHCFGCGVGGSAIDFIMKFKNCDFKEAVEILSCF